MSYGYSLRLIELNKLANGRLLGVRLGRACIANDIPVSEVSNRLGVSRQTVYNWFVGESSPHNSMTNQIEQFFKKLQR